MTGPKRSGFPGLEFPSLQWEPVEDHPDTRPLELHERPFQVRVDIQLAVIAEINVRVALNIENMWGQPECVPYICDLVFGGVREGQSRQGFKREVVAALMTLADLHKQAFGLMGHEESRP